MCTYDMNTKLGRLSVLSDEKDYDITFDHTYSRKKREGTNRQYFMLVMALLPYYHRVIWLQSNAVNITSWVDLTTSNIQLASKL